MMEQVNVGVHNIMFDGSTTGMRAAYILSGFSFIWLHTFVQHDKLVYQNIAWKVSKTL